MKTSEFIVRRILLLIPVMIGVTVFTFMIAQIIPSNPAAILCGERWPCRSVTGKTMLELQIERLGLDKPVTEQFTIYLQNLLEGDWGESTSYNRPTAEVVRDAAPVTLEMTLFALLIAYPVGITLGILSAVKQDQTFDHISVFLAISFVSLPIFWLAMMLQLYLGTGSDVGGYAIQFLVLREDVFRYTGGTMLPLLIQIEPPLFATQQSQELHILLGIHPEELDSTWSIVGLLLTKHSTRFIQIMHLTLFYSMILFLT